MTQSNMNNVAFILTCHQSQKIRPNGFYIVDRFIQSIHEHCEFKHTIYLYDNTSEDKFPIDDYHGYNIEYEYVEDQTIRGNTGPWNDGVTKAINNGADLVIICNDDLILNKSINSFIKQINNHSDNHKSIYGPLCQPQGVLGGPQGVSQPTNKIYDTDGYILNGFLFAFTKELYHSHKVNDEIFSSHIDYIWNANEIEFQQRLWKDGVRSFVVGHCWIYHEKIRAWKAHINPTGNQATMTVEQRLQNSANKLEDYEKNWKAKFELLNKKEI